MVTVSLLLVDVGRAFQTAIAPPLRFDLARGSKRLHAATGIEHGEFAQSRVAKEEEEQIHFLLTEFTTASGELVDPYKTLKVPRDAGRTEIRSSYRNLSRRYHPDGVRHRKILPGSW